jgi:PAS domain S-box-containing protein
MATILVVDDQPVNREFLSTLLGYAGHRLVEAADGAEALEKAQAERPDLVIADILMPNMDGVEFTQLLRASAELPQVPVIFYTATYRVEEARSLAQSCGASMVLGKPSTPEQILAAVHEFLVLPTPRPEAVLRELPAEDPHLPELRALTLRMNALGEEVLATGAEEAAGLRRAFQDLQRLSLRLSNLVEVGVDLAGQRDVETLLQGFCRAARHLGTARYAVLGVLDEEGKLNLFARGLWSDDLEPFGELGPRDGVLGRLLEERRPLRLRPGGPRELGLPPSHPPLASFLGVPFASPTRVYGWLYLADRLGAAEFGEEDEQLVSTLAAQVGLAYENLLLCEEVQQAHEESRRTAAQLQLEIREYGRMEEAARASRERLQHLAASIPAVFYSLKVLPDLFAPGWVSENIAQLTGWTSAEALAPHWWFEHLHPEDWVQALAGWDRLIAQGQGVREYRFRRRDGTYLWVRDSGRALRDREGNPAEVVGTWTDISALKQREEAQARVLEQLRERVERMRAPEDLAPTLEAVKEALEALGVSFQAWSAERLRETSAEFASPRFRGASEEGRAIEAILRVWREGMPGYRPGPEGNRFSAEDLDFLGRLIEILAEGFHRLDQAQGRSGIAEELERIGAEFSPPEAGEPATAPARQLATVLLVEDEAALRRLLALTLREAGYAVLEAGRGEEALEVMARHPGEVHLLLTDLMMPGMVGCELAERLRALRPEMKVLYMSGYSEELFTFQTGIRFSEAFLQKPFRSGALLLKVSQVLGGEGAT